MEKVKALLLPLALVFAAIAVFEFGARYGASNTRALALAGQLQNYLGIYVQALPQMDENSRERLELVIDNHIATASVERGAWYLRFKQEPRGTLDKVLTNALAVRGDGVIERFDNVEASEDLNQIKRDRLEEIRAALRQAKVDLVDNAPKVETPAE